MIILIFFIIFFQLFFPQYLKIFGISPNLALLFLIFNIFFQKRDEGYFISIRRNREFLFLRDINSFFVYPFFIGLIFDFLSVLPFGVIAVSLVLTSFIIYLFFNAYLNQPALLILGLITAAATLFYNLFIFFITRLVGIFRPVIYSIDAASVFLKLLPVEILYHLLMIFALFYVFRQIKKNLYQKVV